MSDTTRRTVGAVLATVVALAATTATAAASPDEDDHDGLCFVAGPDVGHFVDIGPPHQPSIDCLAGIGVAEVPADARFRPNDPVHRDQLAAFLDRTIDVLVERFDDLEPEAGEGPQFRDVAGNVHREAIERSAARGYVQGYDDETFRPRNTLTRGQLASVVVRVYEDLIGPIDNQADGTPDVEGSPHDGSINKARSAELMQGYDDGTFRPNRSVTRGQVATVLRNLGDQVVEHQR